MAKITFIKPDGSRVVVEAESGTSIMEAGRDADVGIEGTCGGCISCATCHVIIDDAWFDKIGPAIDDEDDMLDMAVGRQANSRLGCQIEISDSLDGLTVTVAEEF